jgi:hypothetical protein
MADFKIFRDASGVGGIPLLQRSCSTQGLQKKSVFRPLILDALYAEGAEIEIDEDSVEERCFVVENVETGEMFNVEFKCMVEVQRELCVDIQKIEELIKQHHPENHPDQMVLF